MELFRCMVMPLSLNLKPRVLTALLTNFEWIGSSEENEQSRELEHLRL